MSGFVDGESHEKFRLIGSRFTFSRSWKPNLETSFGQSVIKCRLCGQRERRANGHHDGVFTALCSLGRALGVVM